MLWTHIVGYIVSQIACCLSILKPVHSHLFQTSGHMLSFVVHSFFLHSFFSYGITYFVDIQTKIDGDLRSASISQSYPHTRLHNMKELLRRSWLYTLVRIHLHHVR